MFWVPMRFSDKVIIDDKQAAYEAVQSLIDKGKENRPCHHC
jgi:DNA-binding LacI/PurR family transcriptional regulator